MKSERPSKKIKLFCVPDEDEDDSGPPVRINRPNAPRFIPKREREAQQKLRQEEEEEKRKRAESSRSVGDKFLEGNHRNGEPKPSPDVNQLAGPRPVRDKDENGNPLSADQLKEERRRFAHEQRQLEQRKRRYYGTEDRSSTFKVKKSRKTGNKFNFEWNEDEDTTEPFDMNDSVHRKVVEAEALAHGRRNGFGNDLESLKRYVKQIEESDPVTGKERAKAIMESELQRNDRESRKVNVNNHWSKKELSRMTDRDFRIMREDHNIITTGGNIPNPLRSWEESSLSPDLLTLISRNGYEEPSPVQRAAIPCAMAGRDVLAVAQTGSGKTASFLFPLIMYILRKRRPGVHPTSPFALVLAPTRELAQQIEVESKKFANPLNITTVCVTGGHDIGADSWNLRDGCDILIATPGRLVDCIDRRVVVLGETKYLILDEADRMLDMGFEEPVTKIVSSLNIASLKPDTEESEHTITQVQLNKDDFRTTMMYTATMPPSVERLSRSYLRRPARVSIAQNEASDTVVQTVEMIPGEDKRIKRLLEILRNRSAEQQSVLVFANIKKVCDSLGRELKRHHKTAIIHGGKTQTEREEAIEAMRNGKMHIMVATDVAGRGIDIPDIGLVVNINMPSTIDAYVHRVGRTGRAGKKGLAITFLGDEDQELFFDLRAMLNRSPSSKVPDELRKHEASQNKRVRGGTGSGAAITE